MCDTPKPQPVPAPPPPPPPPPPKLISPEEANATTRKVADERSARSSRSKLRIDLGTGGSSSGLAIPQG